MCRRCKNKGVINGIFCICPKGIAEWNKWRDYYKTQLDAVSHVFLPPTEATKELYLKAMNANDPLIRLIEAIGKQVKEDAKKPYKESDEMKRLKRKAFQMAGLSGAEIDQIFTNEKLTP